MWERGQLVGRSAELAALRGRSDARLLTLFGAAGVGKTRLAKEIAPGAPWCALAGARDDDALLQAVALGIHVTPSGVPLSTAIARALGRLDRVVLDGADELAVRPWVERWLADSDVRFVATAARPLGIAGEEACELERLALDDAVAMWRASMARFGGQSGEAAHEIVARLDRLPLALEWFAPRAAFIGEEAGLERLRSSGDALPLSASLEASLEALGAADRDLLACLSLFESGAPAAAVEVLADLSRLDALLQRALVYIERDGRRLPRVTVYRSVQKRMRDSTAAEREAFEQRHADAVLRLVGSSPELAREERRELEAIAKRSGDPARALRACLCWCDEALHDGSARATYDTLRALLERVHAPGEPVEEAMLALARLARRLGRFDEARAHLAAGASDDHFAVSIELAHLDRMQSRSAAALAGYQAALEAASSDEQRCIALGEVGRMLQSLGSYGAAEREHSRAIALCSSLGLTRREALERSLHARATHRGGAVREAIRLHERALELHRRLGDRRLASVELGHLAFCHHELDEAERAEVLFRESIDGLAAVGDVVLECIERTLLARLLSDENRHREAELELAIVAAVTREIDMPRVELTRLFVAGMICFGQGDVSGARGCWRAANALGLHLEVGFEALLPAHLALSEALAGDMAAAERSLAEHAHTIAGLSMPGLSAAFEILSAAVGAAAMPELPASIVASSSDVRRARRFTGGGSPALGLSGDANALRLPDGRKVTLGRRAAPRRILLALARARLDGPGRALTADALIAAGWPGEKMQADAARKRLRTAIWTLRKLGLEGHVLTRDDGYLLDPRLSIAWDDGLAVQ